jgi:DNA polymerase-1
MVRKRRFLLIDGHAVVYRAFYGMPELATRDGRPTGTLLGFARSIESLARRTRASHWAVVFDGGVPESRTSRLPTYKSRREAPPDALDAAWETIDAYLDAAEVPWFCLAGEEADDVIATLVRQAVGAGALVWMATSDKDLYQLVGPRVKFLPLHRPAEVMGPRAVQTRTGVRPEAIVDWLSLMGDEVDDIPGVPGVGPKTAARLLARYRSLEGLWAHIGDVSGPTLRKTLQRFRDRAFENRELVRLRDDLPCELRWRDVRVRRAKAARVVPLLEQLELTRFVKELQNRQRISR